MDNFDARAGKLAIRLLRVREAVEKVEETKLSLQQIHLRQMVIEHEQAEFMRQQLERAVFEAATPESWPMLQHQWLGMSKAEEIKRQSTAESRQSVDVQRTRVTKAHIESERWRIFHQVAMEREKSARLLDEQKQLDDAAITRFIRRELEDSDDSIV